MSFLSGNKIEKFKRKPKHSEQFDDLSKVHNKKGKGKQKYKKKLEHNF